MWEFCKFLKELYNIFKSSVVYFYENRIYCTMKMKYWSRKKDKLKLRFKEINGKDLSYTLGQESDMLEKLKNKLGISKEELLKIIIEY